MACPYFEPTKLRVEVPPLLPLRDFWSGLCHAQAPAFQPDEHLLTECCNMGYARGKCARFPAGPGPDAVRFQIASDSGGMILVSFSTEANHHPHSHGSLKYSREAGRFIAGHPDAVIEKLAEAYVAGYLRRRPAAA